MALLRPPEDHAQKKSAHAAEQNRPDVLSRRRAWFEGQLELDPERLVFIDETGASTKMARLYGRAPRGQRLRAGVPWMIREYFVRKRFSGWSAEMDRFAERRAALEARVEPCAENDFPAKWAALFQAFEFEHAAALGRLMSERHPQSVTIRLLTVNALLLTRRPDLVGAHVDAILAQPDLATGILDQVVQFAIGAGDEDRAGRARERAHSLGLA